MEGGPNIQERDSSVSDSFEGYNTESGCAYLLCNPRGKLHRFIALVFMCFLGFGSYFCYDNPAALQDNFTKDLQINNKQYSLLYSLYSWPNTVLCFVGGFLIDRVFGIRLGTNIYMLLTLIGQIVFASGALFNMFWMMVLGRFIFGIGGESLAVAQNNYAVLWFKGKELNMVFGLQLSFARVGSAVNFWVMEPVYAWVNESYSGYQCLGIALFVAGCTCILSMFCALVIGALDSRAERMLRRNENATEEKIQLKDIKDFPLPFWLVTVICVAYYVAIFPFIALGKQFFISKFHMDPPEANYVISVVYLISVFASPLLGFVVDKFGRNIFWVLCSIVVTAGAHVLLAFTMLNPYVGMIVMGLAYSLLASGLWPLVALIIPEYQLGTAYGICQSIQNLGLAVISFLAGVIVDSYGYTWLEVFFIGSLGLSLVATIVIWIVNASRGGTLNMSPQQREIHQQKVLDDEERDKLLAASSSSDLLQPNTDFHIRNRYLSRIGAPLPNNYNIHVHHRISR